MKDLAYIYLTIAIITEVTATTALKASAQFTDLWPSLLVVFGYSLAFYCLTLVLETIPLGITYAIWSGAGMLLVALLGVVLYQQTPDFAEIF